MEFKNLSDFFPVLVPAILIATVCTAVGSAWINHLYAKAPHGLLSFPEGIINRSVHRKPLLFLLLATCIGKACITTTPPTFFYWTVAISLLSFVTVTDFEQYVIFDAMLLPFAVVGFAYTIHMELPVANHIVAALGGGLLFFILTIITKGAIGGGDIKLIASMGLWLGVRPMLSVITYGFITGGLAALFLLITKQKSRHSYFAYGPYFALSGAGILLGLIRLLF